MTAAEPAGGALPPPDGGTGRTAAPPELVVGVGARLGVTAGEVIRLVRETLAASELPEAAVSALATAAAKTAEPGLVAAAERLALPLLGFRADTLAAVDVPHPSPAVLAAAGTAGVAEAAALLAAGPGAELVVPKRTSRRVTAAVARQRPRPGGPGSPGSPGGPGGPENVEGLGAPEDLGAPEGPGAPGVRGGLTDQDDPSSPGDPGDPGDPRRPYDPTGLGDPGGPRGPYDPTDLGDPPDPGNPRRPYDPTDPGDPGDPYGPTEPGDQGDQSDPTDLRGPGGPRPGIPPIRPAEETP
ncbi:cobalamin biosynthesis protein [Streptomyces lycii]|nr:cobalamin biosynthesis protein [Streptomyces lycii]